MVNSIGLLEPCLCVNIFQLVLRHNPIRTLFFHKIAVKCHFSNNLAKYELYCIFREKLVQNTQSA